MKPITLSTESWHFHLNSWTYGRYFVLDIKSICPYFWMTVLAVVVSPLVGIGKLVSRVKLPERSSSGPSFGQVVLMVLGGVELGLGIMGVLTHKVLTAVGGLSIGAAFISAAVVIFIADTEWCTNRLRRNRDKPAKPAKVHEPSILLEYIKARKARFCPAIAFVSPQNVEDLR